MSNRPDLIGSKQDNDEIRSAGAEAMVAPPEQKPSLLRRVGGTATTAIDEWAFSTPTALNTAVYGTLGLPQSIYEKVTGKKDGEGISVFTDPYKKAYEDASKFWGGQREAAGVGGELIGSVAGAFGPMGPAKAIDKTLDAGKSLFDLVAPKPGDAMKRFGKAVGAGGTTAALQGYLQGDTSFEELFANGALGGIMGGSMQKLMGDNLGPLFKTLKGPYGDVLKDLNQSGVDLSRSFNLGAVARAVDEDKFLSSGDYDAGGLLETKIGGAPVSTQWGKFYDSIADLTFGGTKTQDLQTPEALALSDAYNAKVEAVAESVNAVNNKARATFTDTLAAPTSRKDALKELRNDVTEAVGVYNSMQRTKPYPDGTKPYGAELVDPTNVRTFVENGLLEMDDRESVEQMRPAARKMYNKFKDHIRLVRQESQGKGVGMKPVSRNPEDNADIWGPIQAYQLLDARQMLADDLSPAKAFQDGISPIEHRAGVRMLKDIDAALDKISEGKFGTAKGAFSKAKRIEDAFDFGTAAVNDANNIVDDKGAFAKFHKETLNNFVDSIDDAEVKEALSQGYKYGLASEVGEHGFHRQMANLIGSQDTVLTDSNFFQGKGDNYDLMVKMLGNKDTNTLVELYNDGIMTEGYTETLYNALIAKGTDHKEALSISTNPHAIALLQTGAADGTTAIGASKKATQALMKKIVKPADHKKAAAALELMTAKGARLQELLAIGLEEAVGGFPQMMGARAGAVSTEVYEAGMGGATTAAEGMSEISKWLKEQTSEGEPDSETSRPSLTR